MLSHDTYNNILIINDTYNNNIYESKLIITLIIRNSIISLTFYQKRCQENIWFLDKIINIVSRSYKSYQSLTFRFLDNAINNNEMVLFFEFNWKNLDKNKAKSKVKTKINISEWIK